MKKTVILLSLIFALAIALSASIPTLAASTSSSTTISGTVNTVMEVSTTSVNLGDLTPVGVTPTAITNSATSVTVRCNKVGWSLMATDISGYPTYLGHMTASGGTLGLANALSLTATGSSGTLDASGVTLVTSGARGGGSTSLTYSQLPSWQDLAGSYTMTIQFTGTY
jgi:hypothetical protein